VSATIPQNEVELSVVVPTHRRPALLASCIRSIAGQQERPERMEAVVVVDGADPETEGMLASLETPFPLRVVVQDHAHQGAARNRGAQEARGRYLLFLDDDVVAEQGLLAAHVAALRNDERMVGLGRIDKVLPSRAPRWARSRQEAWRRHYERLAGGREPRFTDCYGGNVSLSRSAFHEAGGFAVDLSPEEDIELGYRLAKTELRFVYLDDAVVREEDRDDLRRYVDIARGRGRIGVKLYERTPELLPYLRLGGAFEPPRRWVALRRLLLPLRIPPTALGAAGKLAPTDSLAAAWYAFLYGYCYWWGVRETVDDETWRSLQRGTAILLYHALGREGERASRYVLPPRAFARQLAWLRRRRYTVVGLDDFVHARLEHRLMPSKSVVLTFDDGYADNLDLALPELERHGFPATVFLVTAVGDRARWDASGPTADRPLLRPEDARAAIGRLTFGAHSRTHRRLGRLGAGELDHEVAGSRAELEALLEQPVTTFAYPFGDTGPEVEAAVTRAGFLAACTVTPGRNRAACDLLALKRIEIKGTDSLVRFALALWLGDTRLPFRRRRG